MNQDARQNLTDAAGPLLTARLRRAMLVILYAFRVNGKDENWFCGATLKEMLGERSPAPIRFRNEAEQLSELRSMVHAGLIEEQRAEWAGDRADALDNLMYRITTQGVSLLQAQATRDAGVLIASLKASIACKDWRGLSASLFDERTGVIAERFPDLKERAAFLAGELYPLLVHLVDLQRRAEHAASMPSKVELVSETIDSFDTEPSKSRFLLLERSRLIELGLILVDGTRPASDGQEFAASVGCGRSSLHAFTVDFRERFNRIRQRYRDLLHGFPVDEAAR